MAGVASRVRQVMELRGVTMRHLSKEIGAPYRTLQNYLNGTHPLPGPVLARIADALGEPADWFLFARPATLHLDCLADAIEELELGMLSLNRHQPIGHWKRAYASHLHALYNSKYRKRLLGEDASEPD